MLETDWICFLQNVCQRPTVDPAAFQPEKSILMLLDEFSLAQLQGNFNAIIRFVSLFDVIEQLGIGVFIRNTNRTPKLSREAIQQMKIAIKNAASC